MCFINELNFSFFPMSNAQHSCIDTLSAEFITWAIGFLNCTDAEANQLLQRTRDIFDQGSRAIPSMLAQHSVPFTFCLAYLRQCRQSGESFFNQHVDLLDRELCSIAEAIGVLLPNLKTDNASVAQLPSLADWGFNRADRQSQLHLLSNCTAQLTRCVELIAIYPDRADEIIPVSEDVTSIVVTVLTALRHSSRTNLP